MDRINPGTPQWIRTTVDRRNEPGRAEATPLTRVQDLAVTSTSGAFLENATVADRGTMPDLPSSPSGGFGDKLLEGCFGEMQDLEKKLAAIDPSTPEGSKQMTILTQTMQRVNQMINMLVEMRKMMHDANMQAIRNSH